MKARVAAYPFYRIDSAAVQVTTTHSFKDKDISVLDLTEWYLYEYKVSPAAGTWNDLLTAEARVSAAVLCIDWVSGGAGANEMYRRRAQNRALVPTDDTSPIEGSFVVPGYAHTTASKISFRIVSEHAEFDDGLVAEAGGILWQYEEKVIVFGAGGFLDVRYADAGTKGRSAGPGDFTYSSSTGYAITLYNEHASKDASADAKTHGALAVLLERVLRDAYNKYNDLIGNGADKSEPEPTMLSSILSPKKTHGRKSPMSILEDDANGRSPDPHALSNWCWELSCEITEGQPPAAQRGEGS